MLCKQWPCKCIKNIAGNWHFYHDFMILYYYLVLQILSFISKSKIFTEKKDLNFPPFFLYCTHKQE